MNPPTISASTPTPAIVEPAVPVTTAPRRRVTRRVARRISVVRDVLASIKDAGLIAGFAALLLFHDQVVAFLSDLDAFQGGSALVVDVQLSLARINRAVDTAPVPDSGASIIAGGSLGRKVLRAEQRLLRSEDAAFIEDWVVVVTPVSNTAGAGEVTAQLTELQVTSELVKKGTRLSVVARAGSPEAAQSVLNRVRLRYPRALPTTLASWCDPLPPVAGSTVICRRN